MRPCVEKMQGLFVCKKSWLHITKTLCLCGFPLIKVNYPIRNLWDNYRKKYWKKRVKIGVKSTNMAGGYLRKIRGIGYEWSWKIAEKPINKGFAGCRKDQMECKWSLKIIFFSCLYSRFTCKFREIGYSHKIKLE